MKYRADIDGLRALAVVPVVLFHAGFEAFAGGFVGVDVFFVVSGYLITSILIEDIENNRFSLVNFYDRRARRLLPMLFFVMLACIPFAWFWMLPIQMRDFSESLIAVSLFVSNIYFWQESGYFAIAAEETPLLHTWSLAVEEQYYLFFPVFLFALWRFGKNRVFWAIVGLSILSLVLSEWGWRNNPNANFYLALTRAWELLAGSIAAFIVQKRGVYNSNSLSIFGLSSVIFAIFAYDEATPFPSVFTLIPVIGVVLLVLFAGHRTLVAKILGMRVFVGIGLISYSAYLLHQPVFAFARVRLIEVPSAHLMGFLSIASFVLAGISWKVIEQPFRNNYFICKKNMFAGSVLGILFFSVIGYWGYAQDGFKSRFDAQLHGDVGHIAYHEFVDKNYFDCEPQSVLKAALQWSGFLRCKQSKEGEADWILLGDSHAEHLFLGLAQARTDINIAFYILAGEPYIGNPQYKKIFEAIETLPKKKKILITMHYVERVDTEISFREGFSETISFLQSLGHEVILLGDIPRYTVNAEHCIFGRSIEFVTDFCSMSSSEFGGQQDIYEQTLVDLSYEHGVRYETIHEPMCGGDVCSMVRGDLILYRDDNHLNIEGSKIIGEYLNHKLTDENLDR
ncbi:acyltransferase [Burkholderiales bacterium]|nr:acyltransferase [Burkholderiales bacterium]